MFAIMNAGGTAQVEETIPFIRPADKQWGEGSASSAREVYRRYNIDAVETETPASNYPHGVIVARDGDYVSVMDDLFSNWCGKEEERGLGSGPLVRLDRDPVGVSRLLCGDGTDRVRESGWLAVLGQTLTTRVRAARSLGVFRDTF